MPKGYCMVETAWEEGRPGYRARLREAADSKKGDSAKGAGDVKGLLNHPRLISYRLTVAIGSARSRRGLATPVSFHA